MTFSFVLMYYTCVSCFLTISFSQSNRIHFDINRVVGYRKWCNKLWNAIRFAMGKFGDHYTPPAMVDVSLMPPICKWILSTLNKATGKISLYGSIQVF